MMVALACGGRDTPDDQTLHSDISHRQAGAEVTFDAQVIEEPVQNGDHETLLVQVPSTGDILEIDHNTKLAQHVPVHKGDVVIVHGQLYIDPLRYGVHCTHAHTSSGCPYPGWIEYNNTYYE